MFMLLLRLEYCLLCGVAADFSAMLSSSKLELFDCEPRLSIMLKAVSGISCVKALWIVVGGKGHEIHGCLTLAPGLVDARVACVHIKTLTVKLLRQVRTVLCCPGPAVDDLDLSVPGDVFMAACPRLSIYSFKLHA